MKDTDPDSSVTLIELIITEIIRTGDNTHATEVLTLGRELADYYEATGNRKGMAKVNYTLGKFAKYYGDAEQAAAFYKKSQSCRDSVYFILSGYGLTFLYRESARFSSEIACYREILAFSSALKDTYNLVRVMNKTGYFYMTHGRYKEAMDYFRQVTKILEGNNNTAYVFHQGQAWGNMARTRFQWGHYRDALGYHKKSLEVFRTLPYTSNVSINIANQLEGIGLVWTQLGAMDSAVVYLNRSLDIREKAKDKLGIGMCYDGLGVVYDRMGQYVVALDYLDRAKKLKKRVYVIWKENGFRYNQVRESLSVTFLEQGRIYLHWGKPDLALTALDTAFSLATGAGYEKGIAEVLLEKGNVSLMTDRSRQAFRYYTQALTTFRRMDSRSGIARALQCIGDYYKATGQTERAYDNYRQSLLLADTIGLLSLQGENNLYMGRILMETGKTTAAREHYLRSLSLSAAAGSLENEMETCRELSRLFEKNGRADSALLYYQRYAYIQKQIFDREMAKSLAVLQAGQDFKEKEQALQLMRREKILREQVLKRTRIFSVLLFLLMLVIGVLVWLFFRQEEIRMRQKTLEMEQKLLRSQLNPHFIFNSLTAIQNFTLSHHPGEAGTYISRFARLMRLILENSRSEVITLEKEVQTLENYLELQQLRFGQRFDYSLTVDPALERDIVVIPPMLAQPFIENAIEHGFSRLSGKGHLSIDFRLHHKRLILTVEDNGVGRKHSSAKNNAHISFATGITRERLKNLQRMKRKKVTFTIEDIDSGSSKGTRVTFILPYQLLS